MAILLRSRAHSSSVRDERCDRDSYLLLIGQSGQDLLVYVETRPKPGSVYRHLRAPEHRNVDIETLLQKKTGSNNVILF